MTVNKGDVVRIVKAGASDEAEKNALLAIAGEKPGLWDGLEEDDVLGVLKQATATTGPGLAAALALPYYIPNTMYGAMSQAPSSTASYEYYSNLQKNRLDAPFFLSGRPATAKCPPLQLVHRVFGKFETDAASIQPSPDTFDFVLEACGLLADFYPDEGVRQQLFNKHLEHYLDQSIYRVKLTSGVSETDGSIANTPNMPEFAVLHIEYKKDLSTGTAADPSAELMAYHYCLVNRLMPQSRLAASPCFGIVIIGCMLWICGLANVGRVAFQPLTPMFHMLDIAAWAAYIHGAPTFIPYPLQDFRWAEVQLLVNNKSLLFYASDAQTKAAKVIKYVTQYGSEVHQMLSNAGLAPILYQVVQLPGGFMQVEMELLAEEDGWMVLSSLSQEDLVLVAPAIWDALAKVHALSLPGGGAPVLADCRPCNVMVKSVGKSPEEGQM
ncbi:hypothetical protein WJX82_000834 [Trebouxia sp. C0006]